MSTLKNFFIPDKVLVPSMEDVNAMRRRMYVVIVLVIALLSAWSWLLYQTATDRLTDAQFIILIAAGLSGLVMFVLYFIIDRFTQQEESKWSVLGILGDIVSIEKPKYIEARKRLFDTIRYSMYAVLLFSLMSLGFAANRLYSPMQNMFFQNIQLPKFFK